MTDSARITYYNMPPQPQDREQQTTLDCAPADNPVLFTDNTKLYQLVLQVTSAQWTKLFSAATAGADLLYPEESIDVVFPLRQAVDCMPEFCEAVNDCISTIPEIKITLIEITNYWGEEGEDGELPPVTETNPTIASDCDLDNLFGACTQMVDLVDQTVTDIFEVIEALTNSVELANEVLELIPGLNYLASVLDIANVLQEQLAENYAAEYTATVRDELRCALFCAVQDDCTLDFATMVDVFSALAGQAILTLDLEDFIEFFTTGTFSGVEIVYAAFWFVSGMLQYGGRVSGIDADKLIKLSASFLNDPDGDWAVLCDECNYEVDYDFTTGQLNWFGLNISGNPAASYSTGNGWDTATYNDRIKIGTEGAADVNIGSVTVRMSSVGAGTTCRVVIHTGGSTGPVTYNETLPMDVGTNIEITHPTGGVQGDWIDILIDGTSALTGYLNYVQVTGIPPAWESV